MTFGIVHFALRKCDKHADFSWGLGGIWLTTVLINENISVSKRFAGIYVPGGVHR
jgi:hypothetical protein